MSDSDDVENLLVIEHCINDPVVANADPPKVLLTFEFSAPAGAGIHCKEINMLNYPFNRGCAEGLKFFAGRSGKCDCVFSHPASPCVSVVA